MSETLRNVPEEAEWLRMSEKSVRRKAAALGAVRVGSRLLFPESKTLAYLEQNSLGGRTGGGRRRGP